MPRIPLVKRQVELAAGSLGPRANTGAFTAPGRALASLSEAAGDVVTTFAKMEGQEEDNRIKREEYVSAFDKATEHVFNDKSTNTTDSKNAFDAFEAKLMADIEKKGYSKRRENIVKSHMSRMLLQQRLNAKKEAFNRGHFASGVAASSDVSKGLEQLKRFPVGSPMYQFLESEIRSMVETDEKKGYPVRAYQFNSANISKDLQDVKSDSVRSNIQTQIRSATNLPELEKIEQQITKNSVLDASEESVLFGQIDQQKTQIQNNQIASAANHIDVENIGANDFATVEAEQAKFDKAKNGDFGSNAVAQGIWDNSNEAARSKIIAAMQSNLRKAEQRLLFLNNSKERKETLANDEIFINKMPAIRRGDVSIEEIEGFDFVGKGGVILKEQMITAAINAANNPARTSSNIRADNSINQKVQRGEITSLTQKFRLLGEPEALSILEREHVQLSPARVDEYASLFRVESRQEATRQESKITKLLGSKELRVRGSSLLVSKPTGASDERMEIFSAFVRQSIKEGLEAGKNFDDLVNPLSPDFVLPESTLLNFVPSKETLQNEAKDLFAITDNIQGFSRDDVAPPTREQMGLPANASLSQVEDHPIYRAWENSFKGYVFRELSR